MINTGAEEIHVKAVRWDGGWELHISDTDVTQVRTLADAEAQVRDYLASMYGEDYAHTPIEVVPDLGGIEAEVATVRAETARAIEAQRVAADHSRALARHLRREVGLSVSDTATVMGISRGRVSQLAS